MGVHAWVDTIYRKFKVSGPWCRDDVPIVCFKMEFPSTMVQHATDVAASIVVITLIFTSYFNSDNDDDMGHIDDGGDKAKIKR